VKKIPGPESGTGVRKKSAGRYALKEKSLLWFLFYRFSILNRRDKSIKISGFWESGLREGGEMRDEL